MLRQSPRTAVSTRRPDADLLFEIGTEELPSPVIRNVIAQVGAGVRASLETHRLSVRAVRAVGTPRRLTVVAEGVATRQAEITTQIVGPPASAAFGAEGRPTRAAEGFAKSQGVSVGELTVVTTERGRYAAVVKAEACRPAAVLL